MLVSAVRGLGHRTLDLVGRIGMMSVYLGHLAASAVTPPWQLRAVLAQIHFIGTRSLTVIVTAGAFVGMVVALQFHETLVRFGSVSLMGSAVGLSLIRELGPVLTALIAIGRAGSASCAEIGIMRNDNQIDALECMAVDPYRYLLAPKFIGFMVCIPLLTAIFIVVGIFGGWFVAVVIFDLNQATYFQSMADTVVINDLMMGLIKSVVFAVVIVWLCTGKSFLMHQRSEPLFGAEGVSRITTDAVVGSSIFVLFTDYLVSAFLV